MTKIHGNMKVLVSFSPESFAAFQLLRRLLQFKEQFNDVRDEYDITNEDRTIGDLLGDLEHVVLNMFVQAEHISQYDNPLIGASIADIEAGRVGVKVPPVEATESRKGGVPCVEE